MLGCDSVHSAVELYHMAPPTLCMYIDAKRGREGGGGVVMCFARVPLFFFWGGG